MDAPEHLFVFDLHLDANGGGAHTYTAHERLVMLHPWPLLSHPTPVVRWWMKSYVHASKSELVHDFTFSEILHPKSCLYMTFISKSYSYKDGEEFGLSARQ